MSKIRFAEKVLKTRFGDFIPFVVPFKVHTLPRYICDSRNAFAAARRQCDVMDVKNFTSNARLLAEPPLRNAFAAARFQCDVIDVKNFTSRHSGIGAFEGRRESAAAAVFLLKIKKMKIWKIGKRLDKNKCPKSVLPKKF